MTAAVAADAPEEDAPEGGEATPSGKRAPDLDDRVGAEEEEAAARARARPAGRARRRWGRLLARMARLEGALGFVVKVLGIPAAVVATLIAGSQLWDMFAPPRIEARIQTFEFRCDAPPRHAGDDLEPCWQSPLGVTIEGRFANDTAIPATVLDMFVTLDLYDAAGDPVRPRLTLSRVHDVDYRQIDGEERYEIAAWTPLALMPGTSATRQLYFRRREPSADETYLYGDFRDDFAVGPLDGLIESGELRLHARIKKRRSFLPRFQEDGRQELDVCDVRFGETTRAIVLGGQDPLGRVRPHFVSPYCDRTAR